MVGFPTRRSRDGCNQTSAERGYELPGRTGTASEGVAGVVWEENIVSENKISNAVRDLAPCKDCTERFTACSGCCPKDKRGEFGYDAWRDEIKRVKREKQKYLYMTNLRNKKYSGGLYGQE